MITCDCASPVTLRKCQTPYSGFVWNMSKTCFGLRRIPWCQGPLLDRFWYIISWCRHYVKRCQGNWNFLTVRW